MKVAIVTLGLLDTMLPLVRHLAAKAEVDLYISVYGERFADTISSFDLSGLPNGLIDEKTTEEIVGPDLMKYVRREDNKVRLKLFKYPNLKIFNWQNFQLHGSFARALNQEKYDVVHFNGYRGSLLFLYAFLNRQMGKVWTVHDPVQHSGEVKWQTILGYKTYRFLKAHFILHNQTQIPEFRKQYKIKPTHIHFVRLGPYDVFRLFRNGSPVETEPQTVLFFGRISPYKGVEHLIEAGRIARKRLPELKIIIAGKPNYPIALDALKEEKGFEIRNRFIPNEELVKLIESASLMVCPYTDATQSGVVMAAYAFHKPVLATAVGGLPEMVEDGVTGKLIPPKDANSLANAIIHLLSDKAKLAEMEKNIRQGAQSGPLSWDNISENTLKVYRQALRS